MADLNKRRETKQRGIGGTAFPTAHARCIARASMLQSHNPNANRIRPTDRPIVLVGLMGVGKTTVGRRLAMRLRLPFVDADHEIEAAAGMTVAEIFEKYGEAYFRDGERRVIARRWHAEGHRDRWRRIHQRRDARADPVFRDLDLAERAT
jgi:hypothetical protein